MQNKINLISVRNLVSCEKYIKTNIHLLNDISFDVKNNEILAVSGNNKETISLLLRIVAGIVPYYKGKCVLSDYGMIRNKKIPMPNVFYIANDVSLYENMEVLEYLMYLTKNIYLKEDDYERQENLIMYLEKISFSDKVNSLISSLDKNTRVFLELIVYMYSENEILVLDLCEFDLPMDQIFILSTILKDIKKKNKAVLVGSMDPRLTKICADNILYIKNTNQIFFGSIKEFEAEHDDVFYIISDEDDENLEDKLRIIFSEYKITSKDKFIFISKKGDVLKDDFNFLNKLLKNKIFPDTIKINKGDTLNSFERILKINDI